MLSKNPSILKISAKPRFNNLEKFFAKMRKKSGKTQLEIATYLKTTPQFICNIECGSAPLPIDLFRDVSDYLKIPISTLREMRLEDYRKELYERTR